MNLLKKTILPSQKGYLFVVMKAKTSLHYSNPQCNVSCPTIKDWWGLVDFFLNFILQHQIDQKLDFMIFFYFFVNFFNLTLQQHNFLFIFLIFFNFIIQYQVVLGIVLYNVFRFPFCWVIYRSHRFFLFQPLILDLLNFFNYYYEFISIS